MSIVDDVLILCFIGLLIIPLNYLAVWLGVEWVVELIILILILLMDCIITWQHYQHNWNGVEYGGHISLS